MTLAILFADVYNIMYTRYKCEKHELFLPVTIKLLRSRYEYNNVKGLR